MIFHWPTFSVQFELKEVFLSVSVSVTVHYCCVLTNRCYALPRRCATHTFMIVAQQNPRKIGVECVTLHLFHTQCLLLNLYSTMRPKSTYRSLCPAGTLHYGDHSITTSHCTNLKWQYKEPVLFAVTYFV